MQYKVEIQHTHRTNKFIRKRFGKGSLSWSNFSFCLTNKQKRLAFWESVSLWCSDWSKVVFCVLLLSKVVFGGVLWCVVVCGGVCSVVCMLVFVGVAMWWSVDTVMVMVMLWCVVMCDIVCWCGFGLWLWIVVDGGGGWWCCESGVW